MIFYPNERTALFIDGANLYATARSLSMEIDYKRLRQYFATKTQLVRAFYYTAIIEDQEYSPLRPLIDWLDYNGFTLVTKPVREYTDENGRRKVKGNMDIEIAVDMLNIAPSIDHVILFSGDGDFRRLVEAVQRKGVRVTVVSSNSTQPSMISDDLRRQADQFIDLEEIRSIIGRTRQPNRPVRQEEAYEDDEEEDDDEYEYVDEDDFDDEEETV
ncbi:MAG: NYN domain-containing protein [Rhodothalassiaceae bacterium]